LWVDRARRLCHERYGSASSTVRAECSNFSVATEMVRGPGVAPLAGPNTDGGNAIEGAWYGCLFPGGLALAAPGLVALFRW